LQQFAYSSYFDEMYYKSISAIIRFYDTLVFGKLVLVNGYKL